MTKHFVAIEYPLLYAQSSTCLTYERRTSNLVVIVLETKAL